VVYKARQVSLNRTVAVKLIRAGPYASEEYVHRFRVEASAAAVLQHPHIVAVTRSACTRGSTSSRWIMWPARAWLRSCARTVGAQPGARYVQQMPKPSSTPTPRASCTGTFKPSNVLIDSQDQPRITDFGLAKQFAQ